MLAGLSYVAPAQDWEKQAEAHAQELIKKNGPGTDLSLQKQLLGMREEDQSIRMREINASSKGRATLAKQMENTDLRLTRELKKIVAAHGWPTIALVGSKASEAAGLILIHSRDHDWQAQMLPSLQRLAEQEKIFGDQVALLTDKILVARGVPQKFGTQFKFVNGKMIMEPVEDPPHLEQRRARYGLPPMSVYRKMLADMYHVHE
jgi:hypothetical protein